MTANALDGDRERCFGPGMDDISNRQTEAMSA
jgi:hypothetical protein